MEIGRTVSQKGQIVIPKDIREHLGIKEGSEIVFEVTSHSVTIKLKKSPEAFIREFTSTPKKLRHLTLKKINEVLESEY